MSCARRITHEKILTITLKNDKAPTKNNPDETTMHKRKKVEFDATNYVSLKSEQAKATNNSFVKVKLVLSLRLNQK